MAENNEELANTTTEGEAPSVEQRAEQAERRRDEYYRLLKQSQANYENAHQRNQREREQERRFRASGLAGDLLPALDNLERALASAKEAGESGPLAEGVALVHAQLLDALKRHGVTRMEAEGQPFDPHLHQGVMQQPAADRPPNTVLHVLEQGYMIHDRVLRAAKVIVSTQPTN